MRLPACVHSAGVPPAGGKDHVSPAEGFFFLLLPLVLDRTPENTAGIQGSGTGAAVTRVMLDALAAAPSPGFGPAVVGGSCTG